jgi:hypothetical protein
VGKIVINGRFGEVNGGVAELTVVADTASIIASDDRYPLKK